MLPEPGSTWPPPELGPALDKWREWSAWWTGSPDLLAEVYGGRYAGGPNIGHRPSQYQGGIVGALARMWWGRPTPPHETEEKLHVPLAGDLCRAASDMLFSEPLTATSEDDATSDRLEELLDDSGQARLSEAAETVAALGGGYLRVVYDKTVSDRAWFDVVAPDAAIPVWSWGHLREVTFWRQLACIDGKVWRHFEHHEPGWIRHGLYEGEAGKVGRLVPLQDRPETRGLAELVNADAAIATGYPLLDCTYIPQQLPNPAWRGKPLLAPMGRSVLDTCEPMLDALDMCWSSWMRDLDLGRGRVVVPGSWLDDHGPGRGASFDPGRRWFTPVEGALKMERPEVVQFAIRVQEHADTAANLVRQVLRRAGFAPGSLGEQGDGVAITATETHARERRSFITRGRAIGYWRPALGQRALPALLAIDAHAFGRQVDLGQPVNVEFADSVQPDELTVATTAEMLGRAQAASIETRVRMVHPDWVDDQVLAEVARIREDAGGGMPAPFDYGGGPTETDDQRTALGDQPDGEPTEEQA
mgnify:CR=1 FL=1